MKLHYAQKNMHSENNSIKKWVDNFVSLLYYINCIKNVNTVNCDNTVVGGFIIRKNWGTVSYVSCLGLKFIHMTKNKRFKRI